MVQADAEAEHENVVTSAWEAALGHLAESDPKSAKVARKILHFYEKKLKET